MWLRRTSPILAATLAASLAMGACSSAPDTSSPATTPSEQPTRGGELRFALTHDPNGLDPSRNAWESSGMQAAVAVFDTVMTQAADGSAQPYLAQSVTPNADYTEWIVKLRPGITFHDGTPLNAAAVVKFTQHVTDSPITGPAAANLKTWEAIDDLTVRITTETPWATLPWIMTGQAGAIAAPRQLDDPQGQSKPIGTGPFRLVQWDIGKELRLERNPNYWRRDAAGTPLPYLDKVTFKIIEDRLSRSGDLAGGRIDVTHDRDVAAVRTYEDLAAQGAINLTHDQGATEITAVAFNTAKPPFDDVRVRQALNYATDPMTLADKVQWPQERISGNPFPPSSPWFSGAKAADHDLAKARELLAAYTASTGRPVDFTLAVPVEVAAADELAAQWARAGVTVRIEKIDPKHEKVRLVAGSYDAMLQTYFAANDPDTLWHFFHSSTIAPINTFSLNFARLNDPQIDAGFDVARRSLDPAVRKRSYAELQERLTTQFPYLWLYRTDWVVASRKNVRQTRNMTLPEGMEAAPYMAGVFRLTETYLVDEG